MQPVSSQNSHLGVGGWAGLVICAECDFHGVVDRLPGDSLVPSVHVGLRRMGRGRASEQTQPVPTVRNIRSNFSHGFCRGRFAGFPRRPGTCSSSTWHPLRGIVFRLPHPVLWEWKLFIYTTPCHKQDRTISCCQCRPGPYVAGGIKGWLRILMTRASEHQAGPSYPGRQSKA